MNQVKRFKKLRQKIEETDRMLQQADSFGKGKRKKLQRDLRNYNTESRLLREGQNGSS